MIGNGIGRLKPLDGLRSIAIASVLLFHYVNNTIELEHANSFYRTLRACTSFGWIGVDLFFVLSGFLITSIILANIQSDNFFKVFYLRRSLRIFPIYFLLLFLYVILSHAIVNKDDLKMFEYPMPVWYYALYIQNYIMGIRHNFGPQLLTPTWSLAIEEQFYLIFPFLIYICKKQYRLLLLLALIVAAITTRFIVQNNFYAYYTWLPSRIDSLAIGALLATIRTTHYFKTKKAYIVSSAKIKYTLIVSFLILLILPEVLSIPIAYKFTIIALAFGILLFLIMDFRFLNNFLSKKFLVFIGTISYGIYKYHQMINHLIHWIFFKKNPSFISTNEMMVTLSSVIITIGIAWVSFKYFEYPLIQKGKRIIYKDIEKTFQNNPLPANL